MPGSPRSSHGHHGKGSLPLGRHRRGFCTLFYELYFLFPGEAWGIVNHEVSYSEEEIIQQIRQYVSCGVRFIVLRTTEFYSVDTLCQFIKDIRAQVAGEYELVLNIGEFDVQTANKIYESGVSGIYHALRLGKDEIRPSIPLSEMTP